MHVYTPDTDKSNNSNICRVIPEIFKQVAFVLVPLLQLVELFRVDILQ